MKKLRGWILFAIVMIFGMGQAAQAAELVDLLSGLSGTVVPGAEETSYDFQVAQEGRYQLVFEVDDPGFDEDTMETYIRVEDVEGNTYGYVGSVGKSVELLVTLRAGESYRLFLEVSEWGGEEGEHTPLSFQVSAKQLEEIEAGKKAEGTIVPTEFGEEGLAYSFRAPEEGNYRVVLEADYYDAGIRVQDREGEIYGSVGINGGSPFDLVTSTLQAGVSYDLFLQLYLEDGATWEDAPVPFQVLVEKLPKITKVNFLDTGKREFYYPLESDNLYNEIELRAELEYENGFKETVGKYDSVYGAGLEVNMQGEDGEPIYQEDDYGILPGTYTAKAEVEVGFETKYAEPLTFTVKNVADMDVPVIQPGQAVRKSFAGGQERHLYKFIPGEDGDYQTALSSAGEDCYVTVYSEKGMYLGSGVQDVVLRNLKKQQTYYMIVDFHEDANASYTMEVKKNPLPVWIEVLSHANGISAQNESWENLGNIYEEISVKVTYDDGQEKILKAEKDRGMWIPDGYGNYVLQIPEGEEYESDWLTTEGIHVVKVQMGVWSDGRPYPLYDVSARYQLGIGVTAPELPPVQKPDFSGGGNGTGSGGNGTDNGSGSGGSGNSGQTSTAQTDLSAASVTAAESVVYNKKPQTPSVSVSLGGKTLKEGTDYTVSYQNNKAIGTAKVTVQGKGSYKGTKEAYFEILPQTVKLSGVKSPKKKQVKVNWKRDAQATGYEVYVSYKKNSGWKKTVIKKNKTVSLTKKKMKSKKTCYVKVRAYKVVDGKKYLGGFSKVKKVKVK